jgi:hypothetical protein
LAFFRSLIRRLVEEETLEKDPVRAWPKLKKKIPAKPETLGYYTGDEIAKIFDYFEDQDLLPILQKRIKNALPAAWLFPEIRIKHEGWPRDQLRYTCKTIGIQYKRFHGTRHSFGTLMLETCTTITEISHALGHTNLTTTQRYSHMRPVRPEKLNLLKFEKIKERSDNDDVKENREA